MCVSLCMHPPAACVWPGVEAGPYQSGPLLAESHLRARYDAERWGHQANHRHMVPSSWAHSLPRGEADTYESCLFRMTHVIRLAKEEDPRQGEEASLRGWGEASPGSDEAIEIRGRSDQVRWKSWGGTSQAEETACAQPLGGNKAGVFQERESKEVGVVGGQEGAPDPSLWASGQQPVFLGP